jgi:uncharacterized membrane protein YdjX (TVP38/TMEM64 family)
MESNTKSEIIDIRQFKRLLRWCWGLIIVSVLLFYFTNREYFSATFFKEFVGTNINSLVISYILISFIRAAFFLPSTIFIIMGSVLFPQYPFFVIIVSMIGILIGSSFIFRAADFLAPEELLSKTNLNKMNIVHNKMEKYGFWIVLLWSFFPIVPTDLICYVAGTIKMTYWKFILAVFIGELILVNIYVWTGKSLFEFLMASK